MSEKVKERKTIFVTIFEGVEAKNILRTPILETLLRESNLRIIFLTKSAEKVAHYAREFSHPRVTYEVVSRRPVQGFDEILSKIKFTALNTKTTRLKREMHGSSIGRMLGNVLSWLLANRFVVAVIRRIDMRLISGDRRYQVLFDTYRPNAVFLAHLFDEPEIDLLREAKRRKVPTVGLVNSWDKTTARCLVRLLPDELLVFNEIVRAELIRYHYASPDRITVVGVPQYDAYVNQKPISQEAFAKKMGIDPQSKLIVYAPMGSTFSSSDWEVIELIESLRRLGKLGKNVELLVRFQPNDFFSQDEIAARPWLRYDYPGIRFSTTRGVDWDMSEEDLHHLVDTLSHMSLLICYASSMTVDAAVFDKPIINIGFEVRGNITKSKSPTQFYRMEHYEHALKTGGIKVVKSEDALREAIIAYLKNPELDRDGRTRLVQEQCAFMDGGSGKRVAELLLSRL